MGAEAGPHERGQAGIPRSWPSTGTPSTTSDAARPSPYDSCTQQVGLLKGPTGLPPADPGRERRQVASVLAESGLDPIFAEEVLHFIVAEVIQHHESATTMRPSGPSRPNCRNRRRHPVRYDPTVTRSDRPGRAS